MRFSKFRALTRPVALAMAGAVVATTVATATTATTATSAGAATKSSAERTAAERTAGKRGPMYGSSVYRESGESMREAYKRVSTEMGGRLESVRTFFPGLPGSWQGIRESFGKTPVVVSFKGDPEAIVAGKHDALFRKWFKDAPKNRPTYWSYWHEPEDDSMNYKTYRQAWRHLKGLADDADNRKLRSTLILMCWSLDPGSKRDWRTYFPGKKTINTLGFDCYNHAYNDGYHDPASMLKRVIRLSRKLDKPFGIGEFGSTVHKNDGGIKGRAEWLRDFGRVVKRHDARFATYFQSPIGGVDFRLKDQVSRNAWGSVIAKY